MATLRGSHDCFQSSSLAPKARLALNVPSATSLTSFSLPLSPSPSQSKAPKARREGMRGMDRFPCRGHFSIRYNSQRGVVAITAKHAIPHITYQRTDVPSEVEERIREILKSRVANNLKAKDVLAIIEEFNNQYHWLTDDQIRNRMSDILLKPYRLGNDPVVSTKKLLEQEEREGNVVYLDMPEMEGIIAIGFGLHHILDNIREREIQVEEISLDATCKRTLVWCLNGHVCGSILCTSRYQQRQS